MPTLRALRVWRRNLESWKRYAPSFFVAALGEPIFYLLAIGYGLGRYVARIDGLPYAAFLAPGMVAFTAMNSRSEEHTSELQSHHDLVCRLLLEKKKEEFAAPLCLTQDSYTTKQSGTEQNI